MYTSTPLSLLPFSLQHFLLLPSFLQASPPVFAPLFPLIILQMFYPLFFYHPHLSLSPHASVTFISIFCLFPPFSILLRCFFLSLLPPLSFKLLPPFSLPFSLLSSSNVPPSFLLSSSPLSFPPCFRHFYLHLLPLSPLLHPPPLLLFLSLLPPLWSLSFSPFSTSTLPFFPGNSSTLAAYCLSPSFAPFSTLFQPLYFFPLLSLSLLSPFSYLDPVLSLLLSPHIHCLFPPSLVWTSLAPTSLLRHKPNT